MVGYDDANNALTLGDDDSLKVGDYELKYNSTDDEWQAEYGRPIGGEAGAHAEIGGQYKYDTDSQVGEHSINNYAGAGGINAPHRDKFNSSNLTIAGWIKTDRTFGSMAGDYPELAAKDSGGSGDVFSFGAIKNAEEDIAARFFDTSDSNYEAVYTSNFAGTNTWTHIAATYDGSTIRVYEDGVEQASNAVSFTLRSNTEDIRLTRNLEGLVDDIRIYDRALSGTEVSNLSGGSDITNGLVGQWNFEYPETPEVAIDSTGDVYPQNAVPRSTSGSLVPQGLADVVGNGEVLADDGNIYTSVQTAVDNASGWVFVGPGTFNEVVGITTAGLTLEGSGYDTLVDGGSNGTGITVSANNVTVRNLSTRSSPGNNSSYRGFTVNADSVTIDGCWVRDADDQGIRFTKNHSGGRILNTKIEASDRIGAEFAAGHTRGIIRGVVTTPNVQGGGLVVRGGDNIVVNCVVRGASGDGISIISDDSIAMGNRVIGSGDNGVNVGNVSDCIVANNRISDSTNAELNDGGTATVLDGNLTGASN